MIHHEFMFTLPDVLPDGAGGFIRKRWSYAQGFSGVRLDNSYLVVFDGAALGQGPGQDTTEAIWMLEFPDDIYAQPRWVEGPSLHSDDHESYRPRILRTPPSWPDSMRWILVYTGTSWKVPTSAPYRQRIAVAWAATPYGPWHHEQSVIEPRRVYQPSTSKPWLPAGIWCVSAVTWGCEVLVVGRDASIPDPMHEVYRLHPDLTSERIGAISFGKPLGWLSDMTLGEIGVRALHNATDHGDGAGCKAIIEEYAPMPPTSKPWPEMLVMAPSGRVFQHPDPVLDTFDAGYLRAPDGNIGLGESVLASAANPAGVFPSGPTKIGGWWGQMWTSVPDPVLLRTPQRVEVVNG